MAFFFLSQIEIKHIIIGLMVIIALLNNGRKIKQNTVAWRGKRENSIQFTHTLTERDREIQL